MTQARSTTRTLGTAGLRTFPIALGAMGMVGMYGDADEAEGIATIDAALERGVTMIDTGDFYGTGRNELLVGRALRGKRDRAQVSVKFGALRDPSGGFIGYDARPVAVKNALAHSLTRLGLDYVDVYRPARLDPAVPIEETIGAIAELVKAGYVRHIGLSEVGAETIRRAHAVHPIVDLQIEYSLITRGVEATILPVLRELGIGVTAYGVLSRGLLTGSKPTGPNDFRTYLPRFTGEDAAKNQSVVEALAGLAANKGVTPSQLAIAWVLSRGDDIVPLVGARARKQLAETLDAVTVTLSTEELDELSRVVSPDAIVGDRYAAPQMAMLDSER